MSILLKVLIIISILISLYFIAQDIYEILFDEYVATLDVVIYYNRQEQEVVADFSEYESKNLVTITIFSIKAPQNEEEASLEGQKIYHKKALIRCMKNTENVINWWFLE